MLKQARKFFQEYVDGWRRFGNVTQERRLAGDSEHLPRIRGARRPHQLPNTYHDIESHRGDDISWKNRSKVRHQWEPHRKGKRELEIMNRRR